MGKILVIGAGGVGSVAVHKMAMNANIFTEITLASRRVAKCDAIAESVLARTGVKIATAQVDADDVDATSALIERVKPDLVCNLALPYQDLNIMDACLRTGVHYMDTANYEPRDEAKFEYGWQWAYHDRFRQAGLMALLGSGFDPGVTSVFATYIKKHLLDRIDTLDILDCNGGDHGQHFATNFNPEINIREVTAPSRHWQDGEWVEGPALSHKQVFDFEAVGEKNMYLMYHEELESLAKHYPEIKRIRFWMTFGDAYLKHLEVLQNVGMTRIDPVMYEGREIIPLQFLKAVLPEPASLGETHQGQDQHRRHRHRREGWPGQDGLCLQYLRSRGRICRDRQPGGELHHRRSGNDRRGNDPHRQMDGCGGVQHGAVRSRSVHGHAQPAWPALAGEGTRRAAGVLN